MKNLHHMFAFFGTAVILVIAIRIVHYIPSFLGQQTHTAWATFDRPRHILPFHAAFPIYYPDYLNWPPSDILTFGQPPRCLVFHLQRPNAVMPSYAIQECQHNTTIEAPTRLDLHTIDSLSYQTIHEIPVTFYYGTCQNHRTCMQATWVSGVVHYSIISNDSRGEWLRMVTSMLARRVQEEP